LAEEVSKSGDSFNLNLNSIDHDKSIAMSSTSAFSAPTLDRPFGVELWPIFSSTWEQIKGYPAEQFRFVPFQTPLSTLKETAFALITYYVVIFGGRELMKSRPAYKLNSIFLVHNFYLTAISLVLLVLFVEQLLPTLVRKGIFFAICDTRGGWTDKLVVLYFVCPSRPGWSSAKLILDS